MDATEKRAALAQIARAAGSCKDCELHQGRTHSVPGEGNPDAGIVFIGEGPGFYEDQQGRPFVGASGKFLDDLLRSIGLDRKTVFIANVVKCRPPNNRDPQADEIEACRKYLDGQLAAIARDANCIRAQRHGNLFTQITNHAQLCAGRRRHMKAQPTRRDLATVHPNRDTMRGENRFNTIRLEIEVVHRHCWRSHGLSVIRTSVLII